MIVASIRTAAARPMPISFMSISGSMAKTPNTRDHHHRRARDHACRRLDPVRDGVLGVERPRSYASRIRLRMNTW